MKSSNDKAPGPDGLPIEYYKLAPDLWARIYEVIHDFQLSKGKMTKFQRRAHLSLLYKAGDRSLPGNYRPLTLLNHDAKLGPKVLAWRLGEVLPGIINEDQKGFDQYDIYYYNFKTYKSCARIAIQTRARFSWILPRPSTVYYGQPWTWYFNTSGLGQPSVRG
ncbi:hypothetical protein ON010_g18931 [Phytophthora cinnamomi]|nr:hypothetical protein ON010_g18931 [Phytophthora cinnamomi]